MNLLKSPRKKGVKATLLSTPVRPEPFEIEHSMRTEFQRHHVVHTLENVEKFLLSLKATGEIDVTILDSLVQEVHTLAQETLSFKS